MVSPMRENKMMILRGKSYVLRPTSHSSDVMKALDEQRRRHDKSLCDVTLSVDGSLVHAHKAVLAACSAYFKQRFAEKASETKINRQEGEIKSSSDATRVCVKQRSVESIQRESASPAPKRRRNALSESVAVNLSTCDPISPMSVMTASPCSSEPAHSPRREPIAHPSVGEVIHLPGIKSKPFGYLLDYMYTAELSINEENVYEILLISCLLQIRTVVEACILVLSKEPRWKIASGSLRYNKTRLMTSKLHSRRLVKERQATLMSQCTLTSTTAQNRIRQKTSSADTKVFPGATEMGLPGRANQTSAAPVVATPKEEVAARSRASPRLNERQASADDSKTTTTGRDLPTTSKHDSDKAAVNVVPRSNEAAKCARPGFGNHVKMEREAPGLHGYTEFAVANAARTELNCSAVCASKHRNQADKSRCLAGKPKAYSSSPTKTASPMKGCNNATRRSRTASEGPTYRNADPFDLSRRPRELTHCHSDGSAVESTSTRAFKGVCRDAAFSLPLMSSEKAELIMEPKGKVAQLCRQRHVRSNSDEAVNERAPPPPPPRFTFPPHNRRELLLPGKVPVTQSSQQLMPPLPPSNMLLPSRYAMSPDSTRIPAMSYPALMMEHLPFGYPLSSYNPSGVVFQPRLLPDFSRLGCLLRNYTNPDEHRSSYRRHVDAASTTAAPTYREEVKAGVGRQYNAETKPSVGKVGSAPVREHQSEVKPPKKRKYSGTDTESPGPAFAVDGRIGQEKMDSMRCRSMENIGIKSAVRVDVHGVSPLIKENDVSRQQQCVM